MTIDEAKKILLAADLDPLVREAVNTLSPDLDFQDLPGEEWRDLVDEKNLHNGAYQISNYGRARSFKQGKVKLLKTQVHHRDGNKQNNCVDNLQWVTPSQNVQFAYDSGVIKNGCAHCRATLTPEQVRDIRANCEPGDLKFGINSFARKFHVSDSVISNVYHRITYKDVE